MALDVFVGSLTRYYTGDWQNVAERSAGRRGAAPPIGRPRDAGSVRPTVLAWRDALAASLGGNVIVGLDWDESAETPYFTGRPGWDERTAVMLAARWASSVGNPQWTDDERAEALAVRDQLRDALAELPDRLRGKVQRLVELTDERYRSRV